MTPIFSLVSALSSLTRPALTWITFSLEAQSISQREELGGPVVARWLAKTMNLLGTDLADLFGTEAGGRRLLIDMPGTWQESVWLISAFLMGWRVDLAPATGMDHIDVYVTNRHTPEVEVFLASGADVILHDTTPLALSWGGSLPAGAIDALGALMSQPDALMVDGVDLAELHPVSGTTLCAQTLVLPTSFLPEVPAAGTRFCLTYPSPSFAETLLSIWNSGCGALVLPADIPAETAARITQAEKVPFTLL